VMEWGIHPSIRFQGQRKRSHAVKHGLVTRLSLFQKVHNVDGKGVGTGNSGIGENGNGNMVLSWEWVGMGKVMTSWEWDGMETVNVIPTRTPLAWCIYA